VAAAHAWSRSPAWACVKARCVRFDVRAHSAAWSPCAQAARSVTARLCQPDPVPARYPQVTPSAFWKNSGVIQYDRADRSRVPLACALRSAASPSFPLGRRDVPGHRVAAGLKCGCVGTLFHGGARVPLCCRGQANHGSGLACSYAIRHRSRRMVCGHGRVISFGGPLQRLAVAGPSARRVSAIAVQPARRIAPLLSDIYQGRAQRPRTRFTRSSTTASCATTGLRHRSGSQRVLGPPLCGQHVRQRVHHGGVDLRRVALCPRQPVKSPGIKGQQAARETAAASTARPARQDRSAKRR